MNVKFVEYDRLHSEDDYNKSEVPTVVQNIMVKWLTLLLRIRKSWVQISALATGYPN
jgi:hypothetical protein